MPEAHREGGRGTGRDLRAAVGRSPPQRWLEAEPNAANDVVGVQRRLGLELDARDVEAKLRFHVREAVLGERRDVLRDEEREAATHIDTEIHRRIGDTAEGADIAISPRDEEAGPGGDVRLKPSMRKAFVVVLQKRQAKHRKRGYRKHRDVLVRSEKGCVKGKTHPLQTLEPEP